MSSGDVTVDVADLTAAGIWTIAEVSLALVALHVAASRSLPAYTSKNYGLSLLTAMAGGLVNLAAAKRYGMWGSLTEDAEPPIGCITEAWLLWVGIGGLFACVFLRVYRCHSVLVRHDGFMWPVLLQFAVVMTPFLVPPTFESVNPGTAAFDEDTQECERQSETTEAFAVGVASVLAIAMVALTIRLRTVKLQAPEEYNTALVTSVVAVSATILLTLLHERLEEDRDERRRAMMTVFALTTVVVTVCPLWDPIKGFILAYEEAMKARGEFGFDRTRQPGDTLKISQDRMKINALASSPGARGIPESSAMAFFFRDSLDRESLRDPYLLQASTMRILDRYIREGAPRYISLSESCRAEILASKASSALIFERARREVMMKLGGDQVAYCVSPADTEASDEVFVGSLGSGDDPGISLQDRRASPSRCPPGQPLPKYMGTGKSAVSGGTLKRHGLGGQMGETVDHSTAFGLEPVRSPPGQPLPKSRITGEAVVPVGALKRHGVGVGLGDTGEHSTAFGLERAGRRLASGFEKGPVREKRCGLFIGHHSVDGGDGEGYGSGDGGGVDPFEDGQQPPQHQYPEMAAVGVDTSLDDLDPFMGLQGTLEYNYAKSLASIAGLEESIRLSGGDLANAKLRNTAQFSEVNISGSSSEDDDHKKVERVVNPLFVKQASRTFPRQER